MSAVRYRKKPDRGKAYLAVLGVILLMILYVGMQMFVLSVEKEIYATQEKRRQTQERVEELVQKAAELKKGSRIKKIATEKLGMKIPDGAPNSLF